MKLPVEHQKVFDLIRNSKHKYVTKNMILVQLDKPQSYRRNVEQIISDLVVKYNMPVGASSAPETKGYFIIETENDKRIAKRDIQSRTSTMMLRLDAIDKIKL